MKNLLTFILISIPLLMTGQMNSSIDLTAGVYFTNRTTHSPINNLQIRRLNRQHSKINWGAGIYYNRLLNSQSHADPAKARKLILKSGLRVVNLSYVGYRISGLHWGSEYDSNSVYTPDPTLYHEREDIYDHWFIEIPVLVRYEFNLRKLAIYVETGIAPSIYLTTRTKQVTDLEDSPMIYTNPWPDYRNVQLVGNASVGLNFNINSNIQLYTQPTFTYQLLNSKHIVPGHHDVESAGELKERLYGVGVELGVRKKIN